MSEEIFCSFCGKPSKEIKRMIKGESGACICDECVMISLKIVIDKESGRSGFLIWGDVPIPVVDRSCMITIYNQEEKDAKLKSEGGFVPLKLFPGAIVLVEMDKS